MTRAAIELVPNPRPSDIPAAIAMTFLIAPAISRPTISVDVKTLKEGDESMSASELAKRLSDDATTTAVGKPCMISFANEGPDRNAYLRELSPSISGRTSHMRESEDISRPLLVQRIGRLGG